MVVNTQIIKSVVSSQNKRISLSKSTLNPMLTLLTWIFVQEVIFMVSGGRGMGQIGKRD